MSNTEKIEPRLGDPIPDNWTKQADKEIKSKYRTVTLKSFRDKEDVELHIFHPSSKIESMASDAYVRVFNKLIKDPDMLTRNQLKLILKERGIWGDKEEELVEDIREDMRVIEITVAKMRKAGKFNKASMAKLRTDWTKKREQIQALYANKNALLSNTIEGRAEEEEIRVKLSLCVKFPDGTPVWNSYEEFSSESDRIALATILNEGMLFWAGLTQEIIDELPADILFGREEKDQKTK